MPPKMKWLAILAGTIFCSGLIIWIVVTALNSVEVIRFDKDQTITGNFAVTPKQKLVMANGAKLTVTGDVLVEGEVACEAGPLRLQISGQLHVTSKLNCLTGANTAGGILVSATRLTIDKSATIVSDQSVQFVDKPERLVTTQAQIDALYDDAAQPTGKGLRVGPFLGRDGKPLSDAGTSSATALAVVDSVSTSGGYRLIDTAQAAGPEPEVIGGVWKIGEGQLPPLFLDAKNPPKGTHKIVLNFNFGPGANVHLQDFSLQGPDGQAGTPDVDKSCNAVGGPGHDAMRFLVHADNLTIDNFDLTLGKGGDGGEAATKSNCQAATAVGGDGGQSGNFKLIAEGQFNIEGTFTIHPGNGGDGGNAAAIGKKGEDACGGKPGGSATATGGKGANNIKDLSAGGRVTGLQQIDVAASAGGKGGDAIADPGAGGNGSEPGCDGGNGGKGTATGGAGGNASVSIPGGGKASTMGGNGGEAIASGRKGGDGASCSKNAPNGGNGGNGGDAVGTGGAPGHGDSGDGQAGKVANQKGGDGGNGGNGLSAGSGGAGGHGQPDGQPGKPGGKACVEEPKPAKIKVISVGGHYIPITQVHLANPDVCTEQHWHANGGMPARATDGTMMSDPNPHACGFCTISQCPIMEINAPTTSGETQVDTTVGPLQIITH